MLTTLAQVKSWLGITATTWDTQLTTLIAGVDEEVKRYCARNFEAGIAVCKTMLDHDREVVLDDTPVRAILYSAVGQTGIMTLTYSGSNFSAYIRTGQYGATTLTLVRGMASTKLVIATTDTLASLATAINLVAGWTATVSSGYDTYPAMALIDQASGDCETGDNLTLYAAIHPVQLRRGEAEGIFAVDDVDQGWYDCQSFDWMVPDDAAGWRTAGQHSGALVVVYEGGYDPADIPAGLTLEVIKICCDAWRMFPNNAAMKSETVGDYSYDKGQVAVQIASAIGPHMGALDLYRRV
jgi:hypothetical protein